MELKVWVDGIQRVVCGVTETTTCQDVVYALAHATQQTGRFTLVEKWRNNEKLLAPLENPLKVLTKWGEYANDVHFVMRRSDGRTLPASENANQNNAPKRQHDFLHSFSPTTPTPGNNKEIKKSLTFSGSHHAGADTNNGPSPSLNGGDVNKPKSKQDLPRGVVRGIPQHRQPQEDPPSKATTPTNSERPKHPPPYDEAISRSSGRYNSSHHHFPLDSSPSPGPLLGFDDDSPPKRQPHSRALSPPTPDRKDPDPQYQDLLRLVALQKEKLENQAAELLHFDAELEYWEGLVHAHEDQLEAGQREEARLDSECAEIEAHRAELEAGERALRAELALARSRLSGAETELLSVRQRGDRAAEERDLALRLQEQATVVDQLGGEIRELEAGLTLRRHQVSQLVQEIREANLRSLALAPPAAANALPSTSSQPAKSNIIEGNFQNRAGSTRRIIGSPRQLETAVPTNKNPHGVWV